MLQHARDNRDRSVRRWRLYDTPRILLLSIDRSVVPMSSIRTSEIIRKIPSAVALARRSSAMSGSFLGTPSPGRLALSHSHHPECIDSRRHCEGVLQWSGYGSAVQHAQGRGRRDLSDIGRNAPDGAAPVALPAWLSRTRPKTSVSRTRCRLQWSVGQLPSRPRRPT